MQLPIADNLYKLIICHHEQNYIWDYLDLHMMACAAVKDADATYHR